MSRREMLYLLAVDLADKWRRGSRMEVVEMLGVMGPRMPIKGPLETAYVAVVIEKELTGDDRILFTQRLASEVDS